MSLAFGRSNVALGFVFGTAMAMLNFVVLARTVRRAVKLPRSAATLYVSTRGFLRFLLIGIFLYGAARTGNLGFFLATAGGLLFVKVVILIEGLTGRLARM